MRMKRSIDKRSIDGMDVRFAFMAFAAVAALSAQGADAVGGVERLPSAFDGKTPVVVETKAFKLVINPDATARSLVVKATGEAMLEPRAYGRSSFS